MPVYDDARLHHPPPPGRIGARIIASVDPESAPIDILPGAAAWAVDQPCPPRRSMAGGTTPPAPVGPPASSRSGVEVQLHADPLQFAAIGLEDQLQQSALS